MLLRYTDVPEGRVRRRSRRPTRPLDVRRYGETVEHRLVESGIDTAVLVSRAARRPRQAALLCAGPDGEDSGTPARRGANEMLNPRIKHRRSPLRPAGEPKGAWLAALDKGAAMLQERAPLKGFDVYVVGFHCPKDDPTSQMEAHHYCRVVNNDLLQCVLFDGNTRKANLIGIEYIVSEALFERLPEQERQYWHPHNFEVLSGQLVAPGLPDAVERSFLERLMNSYGKTWHTWHTGRHDPAADDPPGDELPLGKPMLMWSFNREGECDESLRADRDRAMALDTARKRETRRSLVRLARPQSGVDDMADQFTGTTPVPGVVDVRAVERGR
jgi:hypothetical protein